MMSDPAAIEVDGLKVELAATGDEIVDGISFSVRRGDVVGLVGESGSGKTTVALALLGHARRGTRISGGHVRVAGLDIVSLKPGEVRSARGRIVSYVPQDPSMALNPALRVGKQLSEVIEVHERSATADAIRSRIRDVLADVRLPSDDAFLSRYTHQLSGGQQQRVCIAMAFILRPQVIVLDEPTTGLDVTTQAHVLETVRELCSNHNVASIYVSHDLAAVASLATRVLVMYSGRLVENGPTDRLFLHPGHPYTRKLIGAIPDISMRRVLEAIPGGVPSPGERPSGCVFSPRCSDAVAICFEGPPAMVAVEPGHDALCFRVGELSRSIVQAAEASENVSGQIGEVPLLQVDDVSAFFGAKQILHGVSFDLRPEECIAVVGESGSGKTTLARAIVGLHDSRTGAIRFDGQVLEPRARHRSQEVRRSIQYIFQSPYNSLNPRRTIGEIVRVPIEHFFGLTGRAAAREVGAVLERVSLPSGMESAYPDELSGGERQRVAIARALACKPKILICDEITSALDASVQAAIIRLLEGLQQRDRLSILFVTHNLALVRTIASQVMVLNNGSIVETGPTERVLLRPSHAYTKELIADTPTFESAISTSLPGEQSGT
jgi:peptide/nickel transport system ATP-binding protein